MTAKLKYSTLVSPVFRVKDSSKETLTRAIQEVITFARDANDNRDTSMFNLVCSVEIDGCSYPVHTNTTAQDVLDLIAARANRDAQATHEHDHDQ